MIFYNLLKTRSISNVLCRRHLPPPRTNFEKLQDILLKRKGMKLDTSSSGALAASLDQCVVRAWPFLVPACSSFII